MRLDFAPEIRLEFGWGLTEAASGKPNTNAVAVFRGALMYALPLEEHYTVTAVHSQNFSTGASRDFDVSSTTPWNWALQVGSAANGTDPTGGLRWVPPSEHDVQWSTHSPPFGSVSAGATTGHLVAKARRVNSWGLHPDFNNTADEPPASPTCGGGVPCGEEQVVVLVPYGNTRLRMGMLPWCP